MSLVGTLVKVAAGIIVAKTVGGMLRGGDAGGGGGPAFPAPGTVRDPFDGPGAPRRPQGDAGRGGLGDMMGEIFDKADARSGRGGPRETQRHQGGTGAQRDPLGPRSGPVIQAEPDDGRGGRAGELGDVFARQSGAADEGLGDIFRDAFGQGGEPVRRPSADEEQTAALMLRAMLQAARSDGRIDPQEQARLMEGLGEGDATERDFVRRELASPIDIAGLCREVPAGLESQIYAAALTAIDLDNRAEARHMVALAQGLGLDRPGIEAIHRRLGVPSPFA